MKQVQLSDDEIVTLIKWYRRSRTYHASKNDVASVEKCDVRAHNLTQYLDEKENDNALRNRSR